MSDLVIPGMPPNMRASDYGAHMVEGDVYNICERISEIDPDLVIYAHGRESSAAKKFAIAHVDKRGSEYLVMQTDELDARILDELQYLLKVPFEKRYAEAERRERENEEYQKQLHLDKLTEEMGLPMYRELHRTGFIQRPKSYRNMNKTAQRYRGERNAA